MERWLMHALLGIAVVGAVSIAVFVWAFMYHHQSLALTASVLLMGQAANGAILMYCVAQRNRQSHPGA